MTEIKKPLTAAQKLDALEAKMATLEHNIAFVAQQTDLALEQIQRLAETISLVSNQMVATIQATNSEAQVIQKMTQMKEDSLRNQVNTLVEQNVLKNSESGEITESSFVVGRELKGGEVINSRIQVSVSSLPKEAQATLIGRKQGDSIAFEEQDITLEITEVFDVVEVSKEFEAEESPEAGA